MLGAHNRSKYHNQLVVSPEQSITWSHAQVDSNAILTPTGPSNLKKVHLLT